MQHFEHTVLLYLCTRGDWLREMSSSFQFSYKITQSYIFDLALYHSNKWRMMYERASSLAAVYIAATFQRKKNPRIKHLYNDDDDLQFAGYYAERNNNFLWQMRAKCNNFLSAHLIPTEQISSKVSKYQKPHCVKPNTQNQNSEKRCSGWRNWRGCCLCMKRIDYIIRMILLQLHFALKVLSTRNVYT